MGGRIGVESAIGLGSTFWVEVDLDKQPERAEVGSGELARRAHPAGRLSAAPSARPWRRRLPAGARRRSPRPTVEEGVARLVSEISLGEALSQRACSTRLGRGPEARAALPPRRAGSGAADGARGAARRRRAALRGRCPPGFAAVLELPFDKRRLFNVLHSVAAGDEVREGVVRLQDYARRAEPRVRLRVLVADDNPDQPRGHRQDPRARRPRRHAGERRRAGARRHRARARPTW